jgi:hypothetical protein
MLLFILERSAGLSTVLNELASNLYEFVALNVPNNVTRATILTSPLRLAKNHLMRLLKQETKNSLDGSVLNSKCTGSVLSEFYLRQHGCPM